MAAEKTPGKGKLERAVVARGTVVVDKRHYGPGSFVDLPRTEAARLRDLGFLSAKPKLPPEAASAPQGSGAADKPDADEEEDGAGGAA